MYGYFRSWPKYNKIGLLENHSLSMGVKLFEFFGEGVCLWVKSSTILCILAHAAVHPIIVISVGTAAVSLVNHLQIEGILLVEQFGLLFDGVGRQIH